MKEQGGLILNMASSSGFMPSHLVQVYSASKGWYILFDFHSSKHRFMLWGSSQVSSFHVVSSLVLIELAAGVAMFTRSLAHLGMGIRVNALCPEVDARTISFCLACCLWLQDDFFMFFLSRSDLVLHRSFRVMQVVETPILGDAPPWLVSFFRENMGFVKMEKLVAGKDLHHATCFLI
jgi:hypothetical protein